MGDLVGKSRGDWCQAGHQSMVNDTNYFVTHLPHKIALRRRMPGVLVESIVIIMLIAAAQHIKGRMLQSRTIQSAIRCLLYIQHGIMNHSD